MITIAYDLRWISRDPGGITTYALNLLRALTEQKNEFRYLAIVMPDGGEKITRHLSEPICGLDVVSVKYSPFDPRNHLLLPVRLARLGVAVFHSPNYLGFLRRTGFKTVVTVHDLIAYLFPERQPAAKAAKFHPLFAYAFRRSVAIADAVTVDSRATQSDLARILSAPPDRFEVVPNGVNPIFFRRRSDEDLAVVRGQFSIRNPTLLYVGRRDPNKNIIPLIRSVGMLRDQGINVDLLVCGRPDPRYPEPEVLVRDLGLGGSVRFPGFVEIATLQALYQTASAVVYPSSYEGFGLPPIEAMASDTPVVCSARASLPEVVGDAAVFVEPEDPESIATGIRRVITDPKLRAELIRKGHHRARLFSWDSAAAKVIEIYRVLLK